MFKSSLPKQVEDESVGNFVTVLRSGNDVGCINEVTLRRARVSTGVGDRLWSVEPLRYATSHPGQLSLLPSVGQKMSTSQSAMSAVAGE